MANECQKWVNWIMALIYMMRYESSGDAILGHFRYRGRSFGGSPSFDHGKLRPSVASVEKAMVVQWGSSPGMRNLRNLHGLLTLYI